MKKLFNKFNSLPLEFKIIFFSILSFLIALTDSIIHNASDWSDLSKIGITFALISMIGLSFFFIKWIILPIIYWIIGLFKNKN